MDFTVLDPLEDPVSGDVGVYLVDTETGDEVPPDDDVYLDDGSGDGGLTGDEIADDGGIAGDDTVIGDGSDGDGGVLVDEETIDGGIDLGEETAGDEALEGDVTYVDDGSLGDLGFAGEDIYIVDDTYTDDGVFVFDGDPLPDDVAVIDPIDWGTIDLEIFLPDDGGASDDGTGIFPPGDDVTIDVAGDPKDIDTLPVIFVCFPLDAIA